MTVTRGYHSPLRADQRSQVRERIVAKVSEILGDETQTELSVAEVAHRAGVSVRTVYRYFRTKEALYDAVNEVMYARFGPQRLPANIAEVPSVAVELYA